MFVPIFSAKMEEKKPTRRCLKKAHWLAATCFLFWYWNLGGRVGKHSVYIVTIYDKGINQNIFQRSTRLPKCSNYVELRPMRHSVKSPAKRLAVFGYLPIILKSFKIYNLKLEGIKTIFFRQSCIFDRCHRWTKRISKQSFLGRTLKVRIDWKACICKLLRHHN